MSLEIISQIIFTFLLITYGVVMRMKPNLGYKLYCKIFPPQARTQTKVEVLGSIRVVSNFIILAGVMYLLVLLIFKSNI